MCPVCRWLGLIGAAGAGATFRSQSAVSGIVLRLAEQLLGVLPHHIAPQVEIIILVPHCGAGGLELSGRYHTVGASADSHLRWIAPM
jgi:hypothetical protein